MDTSHIYEDKALANIFWQTIINKSEFIKKRIYSKSINCNNDATSYIREILINQINDKVKINMVIGSVNSIIDDKYKNKVEMYISPCYNKDSINLMNLIYNNKPYDIWFYVYKYSPFNLILDIKDSINIISNIEIVGEELDNINNQSDPRTIIIKPEDCKFTFLDNENKIDLLIAINYEIEYSDVLQTAIVEQFLEPFISEYSLTEEIENILIVTKVDSSWDKVVPIFNQLSNILYINTIANIIFLRKDTLICNNCNRPYYIGNITNYLCDSCL